MFLPKNGRTIIIDDERDQAMPLISALSKYNIATTFFDATKDSLPERLFNDVRVLFLDINLNGGQQPNWATEKAMLISNIKAIIAPHTPYLLFVWSVNEVSHIDDLVLLFNEELSDYKPIAPFIRMEKNNIFKQEEDENENMVWTLNNSPAETIQIIKQKINEGILQVDSLEALFKWENIVSESSAEVVNDILRLAAVNGSINNDLKQIYYNLAHAYWGKTLNDNGAETVAKSLVNLNFILNDKIEYKITTDLKIELLNGFPKRFSHDAKINSELNTKLLFSEDLISSPLPGNLYLMENENFKKNIVENLIDRSKFSSEYCLQEQIDKKEFYEGNEIKPEYIKAFSKYCFQQVAEAVKQAIFIEVELTPICDYSQGNQIFCRLVSGVILNEKYRLKRKTSATYFYASPTFILEGQIVNFYCDFRYVKSENIEKLEGIKPKMRIRHLFQSDLQSHLARQVSRPGIVSL